MYHSLFIQEVSVLTQFSQTVSEFCIQAMGEGISTLRQYSSPLKLLVNDNKQDLTTKELPTLRANTQVT